MFFDGCVENSKDISCGNRYNNFGFHGTGIANPADMLAAVENTVFKGLVSPRDLIDALSSDFADNLPLRDLLLNCPKVGNDDDHADKYLTWLLNTFSDAVQGLENERGGRIRAGTGSALYYIRHANSLGSTADGRIKGTSLPANYSPSVVLFQIKSKS